LQLRQAQATEAVAQFDFRPADYFSAAETQAPIVGALPRAKSVESLQELELFFGGEAVPVHANMSANVGRLINAEQPARLLRVLRVADELQLDLISESLFQDDLQAGKFLPLQPVANVFLGLFNPSGFKRVRNKIYFEADHWPRRLADSVVVPNQNVASKF
jgi:hypothetical protein